MAEFPEKERDARLLKLIHEARRAGKEAQLDRWKLPPVPKGFLRGQVFNLRQFEEPCEYGTLVVMEFDLRETPKSEGVPVRLAGTYFDNRLHEGHLIDVPDPNPKIRPIQPSKVAFSHHGGKMWMTAFYPGRDAEPPRRSLTLAILATAVPIVVAVAILAVLHFYAGIF